MTTSTKSITQTPTNPPRIQPQRVLHNPSVHKLPIHLTKTPQPQRPHPQNTLHRRKNKTRLIENIKNHQKHILTKTKKQVHSYNTRPAHTKIPSETSPKLGTLFRTTQRPE